MKFEQIISFKTNKEIDNTRFELELHYESRGKMHKIISEMSNKNIAAEIIKNDSYEFITEEKAQCEIKYFDELEAGIDYITPELYADIWNGYIRRRNNWGLCEDECRIFIDMLKNGDVVAIGGKSWFRVHVISGKKYFIDSAGLEIDSEFIKAIVYQLTQAYIEITLNGVNILNVIEY